MATEAVFKYLKQTNRPYSANDIMMNLHKEFGKTAIQKALDELVESTRIREKVYGKQKVYCVLQQIEEESNDGDSKGDEMKDLEEQIASKTVCLQTANSELKNCETQLNQLTNSLTTDQAKEEKEILQKDISALKEKLSNLSQNQVPISPTEQKNVKAKHEKCVKEYRKRKRLCMDVINAIMEGYPKSKKVLMEEIGIETDEDVKMKPIL
uniref:Homologous-pairing protein 2 homolog n=1 Tax=Clastoptera arizonana TaxID=38151 RepID=A0A1B6CCC1_9HEMI